VKRLKVAFLFNVRHHYPDPNDLRNQREADYDDPQTIDAMQSHLSDCGFSVLPIEADENAYAQLRENRGTIDIAFNYSEGLNGLDRECHIPAILEMLQIPYTGSPPLTQALVLNKGLTKDVLRSHGLPVVPHRIYHEKAEICDPGLVFPLIVKPLSQGSSAGITNRSIVRTLSELCDQTGRVLESLGPPVIVEPFLEGREFSIAMLGNPPKALPPIEPDHSKLPEGYERIDSLEVKWIFEESSEMSNYLLCPALMDDEHWSVIEGVCHTTWHALGIRDLCRIDLRCDAHGKPYVIEVNSPPGLLPPEVSTTSYFPLAARSAGISYNDLLGTIVETACQRTFASRGTKSSMLTYTSQDTSKVRAK
jgi:D-alanine-D-alanine ligase